MKNNGHKPRPADTPASGQVTCPDCGKRRHLTRTAAKKVARTLGWKGLQPYRCGDFWHLGHLSENVRRGYVPRLVQRKDSR